MTIDYTHSALLEIDVQHDFCPGYESFTGAYPGKSPPGALAVKGGDEVIGPLNSLAIKFAGKGGLVVATQDWHPRGHVSFASAHPGKKSGDTVDIPGAGPQVLRQGQILWPDQILWQGQILWPDHCVQGTTGAEFHRNLDLNPVNFIIRKGFRPGLDSYSAFFENDKRTSTGLGGLLAGLSIDTVVLGGLATDYCVLYSALDAAALGLRTILLGDAVRGVGLPAGSVEKARALMQEAGVLFVESGDLL